MSEEVRYQQIPNTLKDRDYWICWREEERDGKPTKLPVAVDNTLADSTDPETWTDFETAKEYHENDETDTAGLGFVFAEDDTICGIDLDKVRDPETGQPDDVAKDIINKLDSFTEVSPSGTGYHIYLHGIIPPGGNRTGDIEMYDEARFFTVTGNHVDGTPDTVAQRQSALADVHAEYVKQTDSKAAERADESTKQTDRPIDIDDDKLIQRAKNADDNGKFERLWRGDTSEYPSHSEARMALLTKLAFWTNKDRSRMDKLFRQSGLYPHPSKEGKWDRVGEGEIQRACDQVSETYQPRARQNGGAVIKDSASEPAVTTPDVVGPEIKPQTIRELEGLDDDTKLSDLAIRDRAYTATKVITRNDDVHIANVEPDNTLYTCNENTVWVEEGENELRKKLQKALRRAYQQSVLNESKEWIMGQMAPDLRRTDLGAPEWTVPVANGLLRLEAIFNGDDRPPLRDLQPEDQALNRIQAAYNPEATAPRFQQFLNEVCRPEDIPKLQEYAGYLLYHWGQRFKKSIVLVGPTDSGKSTFTRIMRELVGQQNVSNETLYDLISTKWGTAQLYGKMVNIRNELTSSELKRPERFKELTGGEEQVNAEKKGQQKFQFVVTQKFLFSTNDVPKVEGADEAFYNRWLFVSFPNTLPAEEQEEGLHKHIVENELAGVLNWALEGLERLLEQGQFTNERTADEKQSMWQSKSGLIARFREDIVEITGDSGDSVAKKDLYKMLSAYADYMGKEAPTQHKLTRELKKDSNISDKEQSGTRYYTGIKLATESIGGRKPLGESKESGGDKQQRF